MSTGKETQAARQLRLDERNHVEQPLLDQLTGMGSEIIDQAVQPKRNGKDATE